MPPKIPNSPNRNSKALSKESEAGAWLMVANFSLERPFVLVSLSSEGRSGCACKPPTRHKLYFRAERKPRMQGRAP